MLPQLEGNLAWEGGSYLGFSETRRHRRPLNIHTQPLVYKSSHLDMPPGWGSAGGENQQKLPQAIQATLTSQDSQVNLT